MPSLTGHGLHDRGVQVSSGMFFPYGLCPGQMAGTISIVWQRHMEGMDYEKERALWAVMVAEKALRA